MKSALAANSCGVEVVQAADTLKEQTAGESKWFRLRTH
jgi:hypothetical protein